MSVATVLSRSTQGMNAPLVTVEVFITGGLPRFSIIGLPEAAVKESKDRVRSALKTNGFQLPRGNVTVNLAPADLPKEGGGRFDLAIAIGVLIATHQVPNTCARGFEFLGELSLSGELRYIQACLPSILKGTTSSHRMIIPASNDQEASMVLGSQCYAVEHLTRVVRHLLEQEPLEPVAYVPYGTPQHSVLDLSDVRGQEHAKRALRIAAAGGHSLLLVGSPGTGKTMLAKRMPGLLPALNDKAALEVACLYSLSHLSRSRQTFHVPPFRSPHHTASQVALVGGGSTPKPGEISLAHHGVLFLDELPEYKRSVLEVLREPMEQGAITISRAKAKLNFPANFQLLAAMNPCPCGYHGDPTRSCCCTPDQIDRYKNRISGPLLDRIDMHINVPRPSPKLLRQGVENKKQSQDAARQVVGARQIQIKRQGCLNAHLNHRQTQQLPVSDKGERLLLKAMEELFLSARGHDRVIRLARTIADMCESQTIDDSHIAEALQLRCLDRG